MPRPMIMEVSTATYSKTPMGKHYSPGGRKVSAKVALTSREPVGGLARQPVGKAVGSAQTADTEQPAAVVAVWGWWELDLLEVDPAIMNGMAVPVVPGRMRESDGLGPLDLLLRRRLPRVRSRTPAYEFSPPACDVSRSGIRKRTRRYGSP